MKIEYKIGDFLSGPENYVAHGCNAQGVMGSGAAKAVRDKYPTAYRSYKSEYDTGGLVLGKVCTLTIEDMTIFNCITQTKFGRMNDIRYVNYGAVESCIKELDIIMRRKCHPSWVAMPMIGAGLANGDWSIISSIIERCSTNFVPVVYDFV